MNLLAMNFPDGHHQEISDKLKNNAAVRHIHTFKIDPSTEILNPYWLANTPEGNLFKVKQKADIGVPQKEGPLKASFVVEIANQEFVFETPVRYAWTDPQRGERRRDIEIVPPISVPGRSPTVFIRK